MNAMAELADRNLIKHIGVSNFSAIQMEAASDALEKRGTPLASNQVIYNLLNRKIETNGVMASAKKSGMSIIAYSPLAKGILTGKFHDNPGLLKNIDFRKYYSQFKSEELKKSSPVVNLVKELSEKYQVSPSQIALNWVINYHGDMVVAIPGATKESHIKQNVGSISFRLSDEDMKKLDEVSRKFM